MSKKYKRILIIAITLVLFILILNRVDRMKVEIRSNDAFVVYDNEYYDIKIPDNWSYSAPNNTPGIINFTIHTTHIANIEVNMPWEYGMTLQSIVGNWMGMHAYIEGDKTEKELNGYRMIKVYIAYEQSPSVDSRNTDHENKLI